MGEGAGELAGWEIGGSAPATHGLGVDPEKETGCTAGNCVFVVDEPAENVITKNKKKEEVTRTFLLQKFAAGGTGEYGVVASAQAEEISPFTLHTGKEETVEGVAVDAKAKRVYFLVSDDRESAPLRTAVSTLYAYSTNEEEVGGKPTDKLIPEGKAGTAVLTGPGAGEFETQSTTAGKPLLEPRGMTVDPYTDEVIILAKEDGSSGEHYVLQRVKSNGEIGARYVDTTNFLKQGFPPDSPIVVGPETAPRVLVNYEGLAEIPYDFSATEAPKQVFQETRGESPEPVEVGTESEWGGGLAVSPDGQTVYGVAGIQHEETRDAGPRYPGIFERSAASGALIGWTGGGEAKSSDEDECVLAPTGDTEAPYPLAAGSEEKLFVLATDYLGEEEEEEGEPIIPHPAIIEFGPGGKGCPTASSEALTATANAVNLKQGEEIPADRKVKFIAHPLGADALSVKWKVVNGTSTEQEVTAIPDEKTGEYRVPKFEYEFTKSGHYTISAVLETDNLDTPLLNEAISSFTLTVKGGGSQSAPAFTSADETSFTEGSDGSFAVAASGTPSPTISESGALPTGVTFNPSTDLLSGTPTQHGTYKITFEATNGVSPNATQSFTLTVAERKAPVFTSADETSFTEGSDGSFAVAASGAPSPTISESGALPTGVTFNPSTDLLSGTPTQHGTYKITFEAQNGISPNATQSFTLNVAEKPKAPPAFTSVGDVSFTEGSEGSIAVHASGNPAPTIGEIGALPEGVTFNKSTDLLSGKPTQHGTYKITFEATNGVAPNATQSFTLTVAEKAKEAAKPPVQETPPPASSPPPPPPIEPKLGVLSYELSVGATNITVSKTGAFSIVVDCSGQSSCTGTLTLRTLNAVISGHSKHKSILTLASGSFSVAGGEKKTVTLHLSAQAREMLAKAHTLKSRATIVARDASGLAHTTEATIALDAARSHH